MSVRRNTLVAALALFAVFPANIYAQQSPVGVWRVSGENSKDIEAYISIFREENGRMSGKIVKLRNAPEDLKCTMCTEYLKDRPLLGLKVLWGLIPRDGEYSGGYLLDVESGGIYKAKIWFEGGFLQVRGYSGIFYRTRTWYRVE